MRKQTIDPESAVTTTMISPISTRETRKRFFVAYDEELRFVASDLDYGRLCRRIAEMPHSEFVEIDNSMGPGVSSELYDQALRSLPSELGA